MEFRKGVLELREILLMLWGITNVQDGARMQGYGLQQIADG